SQLPEGAAAHRRLVATRPGAARARHVRRCVRPGEGPLRGQRRPDRGSRLWLSVPAGYDRVRLSQGLDTSQREGYATALAGLWSGLSRTLTRLEAAAADPDDLDEATLERLPRLQYELHCASELAVGMEPPPGAETAHAELRAALADARDATAEVVDAVEL